MYVACEIIVAANAEKRGVGFEMDFCCLVRVVTGGESSFKNGEVFAFQIQPESTFVLSARRRCCHDHTNEVARNRESSKQRGILLQLEQTIGRCVKLDASCRRLWFEAVGRHCVFWLGGWGGCRWGRKGGCTITE